MRASAAMALPEACEAFGLQSAPSLRSSASLPRRPRSVASISRLYDAGIFGGHPPISPIPRKLLIGFSYDQLKIPYLSVRAPPVTRSLMALRRPGSMSDEELQHETVACWRPFPSCRLASSFHLSPSRRTLRASSITRCRCSGTTRNDCDEHRSIVRTVRPWHEAVPLTII